MNFEKFLSDYEQAQNLHLDFVVVTVVHSKGSIPQEVGARLIVNANGYFAGTIGGGKLEKAAIEKAQAFLTLNGEMTTQFVEWNLQTDIGMSCGGQASLFFERHLNTQKWKIAIFGAGHISQELTRVLLRLECRLTCIDSRTEWLEKLPNNEKLNRLCLPEMKDYVGDLSERDFIVLASMGHATDLPILEQILKSPKKFPYIGVIGSDVKAKKLRQNLIDLGIAEEQTQTFFCPMGEEFGNNTPEEIALSVAAQLLRVRDGKFRK